jgi:hypothetical protein
LRTGKPGDAATALAVFSEIEKLSWSDDDTTLARQGRLRAMVATGDAASAVTEALELAKVSEDPAVLVEAKFILAEAADKQLRKLIEDNPRWEEDVNVVPERARLLNEALDLYLFPYLFFGSETQAATRGLWGAIGVHDFLGDKVLAREAARDLVAIYPGTPQARLASDFLATLPEEITSQDAERDAREDLQSTTPPNDEKTP